MNIVKVSQNSGTPKSIHLQQAFPLQTSYWATPMPQRMASAGALLRTTTRSCGEAQRRGDWRRGNAIGPPFPSKLEAVRKIRCMAKTWRETFQQFQYVDILQVLKHIETYCNILQHVVTYKAAHVCTLLFQLIPLSWYIELLQCMQEPRTQLCCHDRGQK